MSTGTLNTDEGELYYECESCDYRAPAKVPIGLCPHCGKQLSKKNPLA